MEEKNSKSNGIEAFTVIFNGKFAKGAPEKEIRDRLASTLKLSDTAVGRFFSESSLVLKRNIDWQSAVRYQAVLKRAGVLCDVLPSEASDSPSLTMQPPPESEDSLHCPKCGFEQPAGGECSRCGIVFSKLRPDTAVPMENESLFREPEKGTGRGTFFRVIVLFVMVAVASAGYYFFFRENSGHSQGPLYFNSEKLESHRARIRHDRSELLMTAAAMEKRGLLDDYSKPCHISSTKEFVALLQAATPDMTQDIFRCIMRFQDSETILPLLKWYATLDLNDQRGLEEILTMHLLRIGEPAATCLAAGLDRFSNPQALAVITNVLSLINYRNTIAPVASRLKEASPEVQRAVAPFLSGVLCNEQLSPDTAFGLAQAFARNDNVYVRINIAECIDMFGGKLAEMFVLIGSEDPDPKVRTLYQAHRHRMGL
jgi:hypothetical protein